MTKSQLDNLEIMFLFLFLFNLFYFYFSYMFLVLKFSKYFETYFRENFKHICQHRDHYVLYTYQLSSFNNNQAMVNLSILLQEF